MSELNSVFITLEEKIQNSQNFLKKIKNNYDNKIEFSNLKLLSEISSNINLLEMQLDELYHFMLETNQSQITAEELNKIKNYKINNKVQEKIMPYMMLLKLLFENSE